MSRPELSLVDKCVYLIVAEYHPDSIHALAKMAHVSRNLAARVCRNLVKLGWLALVEYGGGLRPVALIPELYQEEMVRILLAGYKFAGNRGEFLMKSCLDFWMQSDEYEDNARPDFLRTSKIKARLEYDRMYFQGVAYEHNGNQHYEATEMFNDEKAIEDLQTRDLLKESLSRRNGIELVVVTPMDLEPATFGALITETLPKHPGPMDGLYFRELTRLCRMYRANTPELSENAQQTVSAVKKQNPAGQPPNRK